MQYFLCCFSRWPWLPERGGRERTRKTATAATCLCRVGFHYLPVTCSLWYIFLTVGKILPLAVWFQHVCVIVPHTVWRSSGLGTFVESAWSGHYYHCGYHTSLPLSSSHFYPQTLLPSPFPVVWHTNIIVLFFKLTAFSKGERNLEWLLFELKFLCTFFSEG